MSADPPLPSPETLAELAWELCRACSREEAIRDLTKVFAQYRDLALSAGKIEAGDAMLQSLKAWR